MEKFTSKNWNFSDKKKNSDIFYISVQNIDCRYSLEPPQRGGSNEYPQSMFLSRNKKNIFVMTSRLEAVCSVTQSVSTHEQ